MTNRHDNSLFYSKACHRHHNVPKLLSAFCVVLFIFTSSYFVVVLSQPTLSIPPPIDDTIVVASPPVSHYLEQPKTTMPNTDPQTLPAASSDNFVASQHSNLSPSTTTKRAGNSGALAHASKTLTWQLNNISLSNAKFSDNYVLSPYSLTTAFGMALLGAKTATHDELLRGLALSTAFNKTSTTSDLVDAFKAAQTSIEHDGDLSSSTSNDSAASSLSPLRNSRAELNTVSKLYAQQGVPIQRDYVTNLRRAFDTQLEQVDFQREAEKVRGDINQFVAQATNDKIRDLLGPDAFDSLTRLVLISAIYLKAEWQYKFKLEATNNSGQFYVAHRQQWRQDVPMMSLKKELEYADNEAAQFVWLPYRGGGELTMVIAVPRARDGGLEALQQQQTAPPRDNANLQRRTATVQLSLPRFKIETTSNLKDVMQALNVQLPFDKDRADFSGIFDENGPKVGIDKAIQKVFIKVDETGTEAAAATAVVMAMRSALLFTDSKNIVEVNADRPFMFWIEHNPTGLVLFSGAVVDPK